MHRPHSREIRQVAGVGLDRQVQFGQRRRVRYGWLGNSANWDHRQGQLFIRVQAQQAYDPLVHKSQNQARR